MAVWGGLRWTPYPEAAVLAALVTDDSNWSLFDGWCASKNTDPVGLPWHRFLNLVYFWATQGKDKKQLDAFNGELSKAVTRWNLENIRDNKQAQRAVTATPEEKNSRKGKLPPPPAWWDGENAAQQNIIAARQLKSMR